MFATYYLVGYSQSSTKTSYIISVLRSTQIQISSYVNFNSIAFLRKVDIRIFQDWVWHQPQEIQMKIHCAPSGVVICTQWCWGCAASSLQCPERRRHIMGGSCSSSKTVFPCADSLLRHHLTKLSDYSASGWDRNERSRSITLVDEVEETSVSEWYELVVMANSRECTAHTLVDW